MSAIKELSNVKSKTIQNNIDPNIFEGFDLDKYSIKFMLGETLIKERIFDLKNVTTNQKSFDSFVYSISEKHRIPISTLNPIIRSQISSIYNHLKKKHTERENDKLNIVKIESVRSKNLEDLDDKNIQIENLKIDESTTKKNESLNKTQKTKANKTFMHTKTFKFHQDFDHIENIGERVYQKSLAELNKRKKKAEIIKQELDEKELKECKIRPEKSEYSTFLNFKLHFNLIPSDRRRDKNAASEEKSKMQEDFIPKKINIKKSQIEINETVERLYREGEVKKIKQEKMQDEFFKENYSFSPEINNSALNQTEISFKIDPNKFYSRLNEWKENRKESLNQSILKSSSINLTTGETLFKPNAHRSSSSNTVTFKFGGNAERASIPIFDRLFADAKELKERKEEELKTANQVISKKSTYVVNETSKNISLEHRNKMIESLWETLSNNEESILIDEEFIKNLNATATDENSKNLKSYLKNYLEIKNSLSKEEFIEESIKMYDSKLNYDQKQLLITWFANYKINTSSAKAKAREYQDAIKKKFSFKPSISESSAVILEKSSKYSEKNFFDRNTLILESKKSLISVANLEKEEDFKRKCSFKPDWKPEKIEKTDTPHTKIKDKKSKISTDIEGIREKDSDVED